MMPIEAAQKSSSVPVRPLHLLRLPENVTHKPSAVERLEADKAKYVKSKWLISTRQEPVKPQCQPLFSSVVQRSLLPSRNRVKGETPRTSLNLQILHNLISLTPVQLNTEHCNTPLAPDIATQGRQKTPDLVLYDSPLTLVTAHNESHQPLDFTTQGKQGVLHPTPCQMPLTAVGSQSKQPGSVTVGRTSGLVAIRRVDVRPNTVMRPRLCQVHMTTPDHGQMTSPMKQPPMYQSKSNLNDCFTRATANLECFFNYCGLAPEEMKNLNPEHVTQASSDIVSGTFQSCSHTDNAAGSECAHSKHSRCSPQHQEPCSVSIIERNARVIKWLYELRQAQKPQQQQTLPPVH